MPRPRGRTASARGPARRLETTARAALCPAIPRRSDNLLPDAATRASRAGAVARGASLRGGTREGSGMPACVVTHLKVPVPGVAYPQIPNPNPDQPLLACPGRELVANRRARARPHLCGGCAIARAAQTSPPRARARAARIPPGACWKVT
eukprot:78608-Chlamydomonas_euryale.AAC.1